MTMGNRLDGRVVIVTGAGRGIGAEVAKWMAADGASVVVNDLGGTLDGMGSAEAPAEVTAQAIRDAGGTAVSSFDSVAEYETAGKIVQTAIDNYGRVDGVCHVAGILRDRMVFNMTEAEWDGVLQVHLYGAFNMVRQCVPHMIRQQYGRIVLFSSGSGLGASGQTRKNKNTKTNE
jgi:NAD(P)-dependent dehydrogenase (short-subunit alcohol dehydrogenase family)